MYNFNRQLAGLHYFGEPPLPLPRVTAFTFRNTGVSDAENCCTSCTVLDPRTNGRINLGVGLRGNGAANIRAANGMELAFTIAGNRAGMEYDIIRTRRNSLWQRVGANWTRLETRPMGTGDDSHNTDECLRLSRSNRIFSQDQPGWRNTAVPIPAANQIAGFSGVIADPAALELVLRFSFAEWVIVRNRGEGLAWTPLELPPFDNGTPRRHVYWFSVTWLVRNPLGSASGTWVLGPRNLIRRGSLSGAVINRRPA